MPDLRNKILFQFYALFYYLQLKIKKRSEQKIF